MNRRFLTFVCRTISSKETLCISGDWYGAVKRKKNHVTGGFPALVTSYMEFFGILIRFDVISEF